MKALLGTISSCVSTLLLCLFPKQKPDEPAEGSSAGQINSRRALLGIKVKESLGNLGLVGHIYNVQLAALL